ncbi:MAG: pilus assembly protein [Candidatus Magasanikbacteria bacterium]|nr:pilus assembly protein [Candidatus Magasanikbacteria bacterium]
MGRRGWQAAEGQALAEAALLLPVLLFLLMGMFVVGRWFIGSFMVTAAAREGVRLATLTGDCAELQAAVKRSVQLIDRAAAAEQRLAIAVEPADRLPPRGEDITVIVVYSLRPLFPAWRESYAASSSFVFRQAVGRATARMEVAPQAPDTPCVFPE